MLYLARLAGRLAQLEERLVYTQEVGSSRLSPPTSPELLSRHSLLASGAGGTGSPSHPTAERIEPMASRRRDVRQVGEQVVGMSKFRYYNRRGAMFPINIRVVRECPKTR